MASMLPSYAAALQKRRSAFSYEPATGLAGLVNPLIGMRRLHLWGALAVLIAAGAMTQRATGATLTWDGELTGAGGSSNWGAIRDPLPLSPITNWNPNVVASSGDQLIFAGGSLLTSYNDLAALSVSALSFAAGAGAFTLNGNAIASLGDITNLSSNAQTINLPITIGGDQIWNGNAAGMTFNGALSLGNYSLTLRNNTTLLNPLPTRAFLVGSGGAASLRIESGAKIDTGYSDVGNGLFRAGDTSGTVTVTGQGSQWLTSGGLSLGTGPSPTLESPRPGDPLPRSTSAAYLNVENGGLVVSGGSALGFFAGANGVANVSGLGSRWISGSLSVGSNGGTGLLRIENGGLVESSGTSVLGFRGTGQVTVTGAGSKWINQGHIIVGQGYRSTSMLMNIENGGYVESTVGWIGEGDTGGTVIITGRGSKWRNTGDFRMRVGSVQIANGGSFTSSTALIGYYPYLPSNSSVVTVSGHGSSWRNSGSLQIGSEGTATLNIQNGGLVESDTISIHSKGVVALEGGTVRVAQIYNYGGQFNWTSGTLSVKGAACIGISSGNFQFNSTCFGPSVLGVSQTLTPGQTLQVASDLRLAKDGELVLAGGTVDANVINIDRGTLRATSDTSISGNITNNGQIIASGGTLTFLNQVDGAGSFAGAIVFKGGYSPGNSPATINFNGGDVSFDSTAELNIEVLGNLPGTEYDQLVGINHLTFNGRLNLSFGNGFLPTAASRFSLLGFASFSGSLAADRINVTGVDKSQLDFSHLAQDGSFSVMAVPEPGSYAMFVVGLGLAGIMVRRRRRDKTA